MTMRGGSRGRDASTLAESFGWDRALLATLRHSSLPWDEPLAATPLTALRTLGARDRLSLLGQLAAHQALLQFAGLADGELDPAEWCVVQKRGSDVRLVRVAARACDPSLAPPVVTIAQQFAELIGAELEILAQSWARADAIYAEVFARLGRDVAADLRWLRRAACGTIASPGPDALRTFEPGRYGASDDCADAVVRFAQLDGSFRALVLRGASPLERYSALGALVSDRAMEPAAAAERILSATSDARHVFVVADPHAFDEGSRRVVELLSRGGHGTWLIPGETNALPATRAFIVAPRIASRTALDVPFDTFVDSPEFAAYLAHGDVPRASTPLPALVEPTRSFLSALALLGTRIPCELATRFLADFLFHGTLSDLVVGGVTALDDDAIVFASDSVREQAARLVPAASRPAICRVAATHANGVTAAMLWLDAGQPARAAEVLEATEWTLDEIRRVPRSVLTPPLASRYAHALIDAGRYREARDVAPFDELVLARAERRMGDYATALTRLQRLDATFETTLLRAEVLRLLDRDAEALAMLAQCTAASDEERVRLDYERGLHGADVQLPPEHYLASRLATYRAGGDDAAVHARESHVRARTTAERIDASLDGVFAAFSAGRWDDARAIAVEALQEVEETQGDRAAGGILFTLAFLAADEAQWAHASLRIARLRHFYTATKDTLRLAELHLLDAHLDFSRGRFADARRNAQRIYDERRVHDQIREAAALILDELDWMDGRTVALRSTGRAGNRELRRRHERVVRCSLPGRGDAAPETEAAPRTDHEQRTTIPHALHAFRAAIRANDHTTARAIAARFHLTFDLAPAPAEVELRALRAAATREYPFSPHDFDVPWCFATRNRLGQWNVIGSRTGAVDGVDWIECSDRERLYVEGCSRWSAEGRDAVAAIFRSRSENHRLRRLLEQEEHARPAAAGVHVTVIEGIVGQSPVIREVESLVARIARRDVAVCVLGESGTGKELVARAIHRQSPRRQKPFTPVNCAALPENLVESELFGHVRGAFTGADRDRAGLIETTDGGTLFLDEIGELPLATQAKLLRFLQEGEFRRVGDTANRSADVRIVSATNRKLDAAVEEGRFRDDLYYRVRGVEIALPPLRERGADIMLLANHFLAFEREKHRSGPALLSADVEAIFTAYTWPGNVRELQNTLRAAHAMAGEAKEIALEHLPERLRAVAPSRTVAGSYHDAVARFKRDLIERSLLDAKGNQNRAASTLKMSRQALAYQIRELGILVHA
ncbi:MAG TPA: sigma 54-interacting transcriptional regulator [Thermoanaerobaculia bacterium]|jgi:DNA-binding NtrC family response regulator